MYRSIELNFIRKHDKSLILPEVMIINAGECCGSYLHPYDGEIYNEYDGKYYNAENGLISIDMTYPEEVEGTLSHEWRHHWQHHNGFKSDGSEWKCTDDSRYNDTLKEYFTKYPTENDAIKFEYQNSKINEHWEWILYDILKDVRKNKRYFI